MRRRGFTLVEVLLGSLLMLGLVIGALALFTTALGSFKRTDTKLELSQKGSLALRRISQEVRSAVRIQILDAGRTLLYELPMLSGTVDPVTGEFEYLYPLQSDGVVRSFYVSGGNLYHNDGQSARAIARDISPVDTHAGSAYYNQAYPVFSFSTVGSTRGLTIFLIGKRDLTRTTESSRMMTTVELRNLP